MALTVNTNLSAMQAYQNLNKTSIEMASSMAKLSSGLRINTAADDAAGLAISENLKSQVNGFGVAARNAQDGINVIQTADGALGEVHSILQRMRDLAVQGANDSNNAASRAAITQEGVALGQELHRIMKSTNFNGKNLIDGSATGATSFNFQIGASGGDGVTADPNFSQISVDFGNLGTSLSKASLASGAGNLTEAGTSTTPGAAVTFENDGSNTTTASTTSSLAKFGFEVGSSADAAQTINNLDMAIANVSAQRSSLGASQNRLSHAMNIANVSAQNLAAAQSHITDTDMASEMVNYTKDSILSQAGTAMLAQANQSGQGVLKLLG